MKRMYFRKSVTLLELMVVLSVMAVLLSFAAPAYFNAQKRARDRIGRSQLELIKEAERMHRLETGLYAACTDMMDPDPDKHCQRVLGIDLPQDPVKDWKFSVTVDNSTIPPTFDARAIGGHGTVNWQIDQNDECAHDGAGFPVGCQIN